MSTITRQYLFSSAGVNSMKSIMRCSCGLNGGRCAAVPATFTALPVLHLAQVRQVSQCFLAATENPFVNQCVAVISTPHGLTHMSTWQRPRRNASRGREVHNGQAKSHLNGQHRKMTQHAFHRVLQTYGGPQWSQDIEMACHSGEFWKVWHGDSFGCSISTCIALRHRQKR